jgi:DNA polymerase III delta prime subunit
MQHKNILTHHHAHVWIGDSTTLQTQTELALQQVLCPHQTCKTCSSCIQIIQKQHANLVWIEPDGSYSSEQIDEILTMTSFKLNTNEQRFFVFNHADQLNASCNNRLLKTIEEPHAGYVFLFLTARTDTLLPTLLSRCLVQEFAQQNRTSRYQNFVELVMAKNLNQPLELLRLIDQHEIKEQETKEILDALITHIHQDLVKLHAQRADSKIMIEQAEKMALLKLALTQLPAPGSAKMFWKNLYLMMHEEK